MINPMTSDIQRALASIRDAYDMQSAYAVYTQSGELFSACLVMGCDQACIIV